MSQAAQRPRVESEESRTRSIHDLSDDVFDGVLAFLIVDDLFRACVASRISRASISGRAKEVDTGPDLKLSGAKIKSLSRCFPAASAVRIPAACKLGPENVAELLHVWPNLSELEVHEVCQQRLRRQANMATPLAILLFTVVSWLLIYGCAVITTGVLAGSAEGVHARSDQRQAPSPGRSFPALQQPEGASCLCAHLSTLSTSLLLPDRPSKNSTTSTTITHNHQPQHHHHNHQPPPTPPSPPS